MKHEKQYGLETRHPSSAGAWELEHMYYQKYYACREADLYAKEGLEARVVDTFAGDEVVYER